MSLHDAIMALNPTYYWPFNDAAGSTIVHDEQHVHNLTSVASDGLGVVGPELNTTANQLFSDQIWTGPLWGTNGFAAWSIMMMLNVQQLGTIPTITDFMGIGDPSNRHARGMWLGQQSTAQNTILYQLRGTTQTVNDSGSNLIAGWNLITFTYQSSPLTWTPYFNSSAQTAITAALGTAPVSTDGIWIQSAQPMVIAHLAWFPRALSVSEIGTVASQKVAWPYQQPINLPYTTQVTGPVTINPTDPTIGQVISNQGVFMPQISTMVNTQLPQVINTTNTIQGTTNTIHGQTTTIQTDTQNIVNTLFPQLADFLNTIMDAVTGTITGIGGAISKTVGQILSGFTLDNLTELNFGTVCFPDIKSQELGGGYFFAIKVILVSYADWYVWTGPGDTYCTQSLGTLEIFRGDALIERIGLHTHSHEVYPLPGIVAAPVISEIAVPIPGGYDVVLVPAPETCWQLIGINLP